jgi:hypothetical protein
MTTKQYPKLREAEKPQVKPGTVGVISGDLARYSLFNACLIGLLAHSGELVGHFDWLMGSNITGNCNDLARRMQGDWLWMIGDDHAFAPQLLERLVLHNVDVVAPHCLQRAWPFPHVIYEGEEEDAAEYGTHLLHTDLPQDALVEVHAVGGAGMLIKKRVLDAIGEPYFETFGKQNEDLEFCRKIRNAGFKIHVDTGALLGHIGNMIVWPQYLGEQDRWGMRLTMGDDPEANIPLRRFGPGGTLSPK